LSKSIKKNGYERDSISEGIVHENTSVPEKTSRNQCTANGQSEFSVTKASPIESSEQGIIRSYLHDIARHSLLSREEEVKIAKEMEKGRRLIARSIVECPIILRHVANLDETFRDSDLKLSESASLDGDGELTNEDIVYGIRDNVAKVAELYLENKKLDNEIIKKNSDSRRVSIKEAKIRN